jgi:hypothetical protein
MYQFYKLKDYTMHRASEMASEYINLTLELERVRIGLYIKGSVFRIIMRLAR